MPDGTATGFAVVLTSDGQISTYNQAGPVSFSGQAASVLPTAAAALLSAYTTPGSTTGQPAILWQNENGIVGFQEETGAWNFTGFTYGSSAGDGQVAAWRLNGAYTFTFLDNGLAQVVSEIPGQARVSPGPRRSPWPAGSRRSTACRPTPPRPRCSPWTRARR